MWILLPHPLALPCISINRWCPVVSLTARDGWAVLSSTSSPRLRSTPIEEMGVHRALLCSPHQGCRGDGKPGTAGRVGDAWQQRQRFTDVWQHVGGVVALAHGRTTQAGLSWRVATACLAPLQESEH